MRPQALLASAVPVLAGCALLGGLGWVIGEKADAQAQASRKPLSEGAVRELPRAAALYRAGTQPSHANLWTHQKGGFYHDGRFATLKDVLEHYNGNFKLGLNDQEKAELIEYLRSDQEKAELIEYLKSL